MNRPSVFPSAGAGYSMVELLATISVMAIVAAVAVPGLRSFLQDNRAANDANALVMALNLARNEAVTRGARVSVCASADGETCAAGGVTDWSTGWLVFTDQNAPAGTVNGADEVLRTFPALTQSTLTGDRTFLSYRSNGFVDAAADFNLVVQGCTGMHNRTLSVNLQGRTAVEPAACTEPEDE